jgi:hypothetical protein
MPDEPIPPPSDINVPPPDFLLAGKLHAEGVKESGWPERLAAAFIMAIVRILRPAIRVLADSMDLILAATADLFLAGQGEGSRGFSNLTAALIGDLLGVEVDGDTLFNAFRTRGRIAAMKTVGASFADVITGELIQGGDVTPDQGVAAAKAFLGFVLSFAVRQGNVAFLTSLIPEDIRFADGFREYGELMAKNLGLGRLTRMVLKPLMTTLAATPFQWHLNQLYHPTQFKADQLVNPFVQELMPHDVIFKALDLEGYSQDKIETLIKLHSKKVGLTDLELFDRYGIVPRDQTLNLMRELGYPDDISEIILEGVDLHRADAALAKLVDAIEAEVVAGHLTTDDFSTLLDSLPLGHHEKAFRVQAIQYKVKAPHAHITLAQAQKAFEDGIWTLDQLEAYLTARGYSADDVNTLELLTLLALAKLEEAKKVAQFAYDKKVAAAKAKNQPIPPPPAILSS